MEMLDAYAKTLTTRYIPLSRVAMATLREWYKESKGEYVPPPGDRHIKKVQGGWIKLVEEAEVVDFRFHDLRHDFASQLVKSKIPLYEVKVLLGHSSIDLTERYAHLDDEQLLNAVEVLD